jgi:hypothetical protein
MVSKEGSKRPPSALTAVQGRGNREKAMRRQFSEEAIENNKLQVLKRKLEAGLLADGSGCWMWQGRTNESGYGEVAFRSVDYLTHRLAWTLYRGPIPPGLCVCHHCDRPACCNPSCLFLDTRAGNNADMVAKGRKRGSKGETNGRVLLTEKDVLEIRAMYRDGISVAEITEAFGVSYAAIWNIVHYRTWKHVT